jgi:hypothetical protein
MKRISILAFAIALVDPTLVRAADHRKTVQTPTPPVTQTCTLKVSGMTCASCDVAEK